MPEFTNYELACLRRDCIRIVMETGSNEDRANPIVKAEKLFQFVTGESQAAPEEQTAKVDG